MYKSYKFYISILICISEWILPPEGWFCQKWSHIMVKMEAFDDSHFVHQTVRGGHTDHTGSIVSLMACIFDLKKKF